MAERERPLFYEDLNRLTREELEELVNEEQRKFDLDAFFHENGLSTGGVVLITKDHFLMTDTFLRNEHLPSYGDHGYNLDALYMYLYGHKVTEGDWPSTVLNDGNIAIQLCSECSSIIWIPSTISVFQYECLKKLNEEIKRVYSSDKDYFDGCPMEFTTSTERSSCYNNLDDLLNVIKSRVVDDDVNRSR